MEEQTQSFKSLFGGIRGFLWFIGISTLIGGIIGVGNIMHASVKERMRDIGIRKAIGAKSSDIKKMVISESLVITLLAGISGSVIGWMCLRIIGFYLSEESILKDPQIDAATIAVSVVALMLSGLIAGLKPAIYAAALRPIESLKIEN